MEDNPNSQQTGTQQCPFCAEIIIAAAKKCKHCGETIDVALRAAQEAQRSSEKQSNVFMNAGGGAVAGGVPVYQKQGFPHVLHIIATFFTFGLWCPIWILLYIFRDKVRYW